MNALSKGPNIQFKRGDTFTLGCQFTTSKGVPVDLTGYTIRSQIRKSSGDLLAELTSEITDYIQGKYVLTNNTTTSWDIGKHHCDIEYSKDGTVFSTDTFVVEVIRDETR